MAATLPTHRSVGSESVGWRAMAVDSNPPFASARIFSVLRLKPFRSMSRSGLFIIGGAFFFLWFMFTQLSSPPFLSAPFPPPRPPPPGLRPPPTFTDDDDAWAARAEKVKESFLHAYHGYEEFASPKDELLPLTNGSINNFNGWGVTMVDSLDTMYMMGLHDEFDRGIALVKEMSFTSNNYTTVPFFETVIRYLGGLLSAYGLSKDPALLRKADELGAALLPAFNTSSGFPAFAVNPATGKASGGWGQRSAGWLAEIASCIMEYKYLAKVTGKKEYYEVADKVMHRMYDADVSRYPKGLLPSLWNMTDGQPLNEQITIGAMADSAFEYFLKQYLLTNQSEPESLELYMRTMRGIIDYNLFLSPRRSLLYVTDILAHSGMPSRRFEHLSCFLPGLFALGANQLPPSAFAPFSDFAEEGSLPSELERHIWAAKGLAISCGTMYSDMPSGLGADEVIMVSTSEIERDRQRKERIKEAQRLKEAAEKAKAEAEIIEREGRNEERGLGARAPPHVGGAVPRPKVEDRLTVNQTEEDIKSRWRNIIAAWREGRYDGTDDSYIDSEEDEEDGRIFGNMWRGGAKLPSERKGPIPGLRDPPRPALDNTDIGREYRWRNPSYQLRPETIESFFLLWRTTREPVWRERGWAAFTAIEKHLRTPSGYATMRDVFSKSPTLANSMPSFFLAETLKYLYLLFSDDSLLPLDKYVLNTEAHPFPVFSWTEAEKARFGIKS